MSRADVTATVAYAYMKEKAPVLLERHTYPVLDRHCARCEALPPLRTTAYSAAEAQRSGWVPESKVV